MLLQMNSNSLVIKQKQKQTIKRKYEDWSSKLNCKIEFFVPYNGHQNCLDKSLMEYRWQENHFWYVFSHLEWENFIVFSAVWRDDWLHSFADPMQCWHDT